VHTNGQWTEQKIRVESAILFEPNIKEVISSVTETLEECKKKIEFCQNLGGNPVPWWYHDIKGKLSQLNSRLVENCSRLQLVLSSMTAVDMQEVKEGINKIIAEAKAAPVNSNEEDFIDSIDSTGLFVSIPEAKESFCNAKKSLDDWNALLVDSIPELEGLKKGRKEALELKQRNAAQTDRLTKSIQSDNRSKKAFEELLQNLKAGFSDPELIAVHNLVVHYLHCLGVNFIAF